MLCPIGSPNWPRDTIKPDTVVQCGFTFPFCALSACLLLHLHLPSLQLLTSQHLGLGEKESQPHM